MTRKIYRALSVALGSFALTSTAPAQSFALTPPVAGYVFNTATSALHPIAGLPGASTLAAPVLSGVQSASLSPDANAAVVAKPDGLYLVTAVQSGSPQYQRLSDSPTPYFAAWEKSTAIIEAGGNYQILSGLGDSPTLRSLSPGLPDGSVTAINYDERSQRLYVAIASNTQNAGLYAYSIADGGLQNLLTLANPIAIARTGSQIFVLDGNTSAIWVLSLDGSPVQLPLTLDPNTRFVAIAASADASRLFAADAGLGQIAVFDLAGTPIVQIATSAAPAKLERLGTAPLLLFSNESGQPVWLLNDSTAPTVFFVPALRAMADGSR